MKIELKPKCDKYSPRFVIVDDNGKIVDDAQGYGYKTKQKVSKAMWYKFKGGKEKINKHEKNRASFFKKHKGLDEFLNKIMENNFKEIARGEITNQDIIEEVREEFDIDIPEEYI